MAQRRRSFLCHHVASSTPATRSSSPRRRFSSMTLVRLARGVPVALDTTASNFQLDPCACAGGYPRTKAIVIFAQQTPPGACSTAAAWMPLPRRRKRATSTRSATTSMASFATNPATGASALYPELAWIGPSLPTASRSRGLATGWRLGWVGAGEKVAAAMAKVHQYAVSSVPAFLQHAAVEALGHRHGAHARLLPGTTRRYGGGARPHGAFRRHAPGRVLRVSQHRGTGPRKRGVL